MNTTLTFQEGSSSKFYSLTLDRTVVTVRYGRIGSAGQEKLAKFSTPEEAKAHYEALLAEKKKKGYVESGAPAAPAAQGAAKAPAAAKKPAACSRSG